jgi:hypothetical protein
MHGRLSVNKTAKKVLAIAFVALVPLTYVCMPILAGIIAGCADNQPVRQERVLPSLPDYSTGLYAFPKFALPSAQPAGSVKLSVISVVPIYKEPQSEVAVSGDKLSVLKNERGPLTKDMTKVLRSFSGSVGEDLQGLLVAKGMTALGPTDINEVTFPEKKASSLTVLMEFVFDIQYSQIEQRPDEHYAGDVRAAMYYGKMAVGLKVYYYLLEPLSEEKMWVKKLDLGSDEYEFVIGKRVEQYQSGTRVEDDGCGDTTNVPVYDLRVTDEVLFDSRPKVFSDVLKSAYPRLMETAAKYFDAEEMTALRVKADEIRERWGSSSFRRGETG